MSVVDTLRFIASHPLNEGRRLRAIGRYLRWQLTSRFRSGPIVIDFVDGARLVLRRGQSGATGNLYAGLHEYPEMAFVLHALRPGDLFIDVGANVGSYTVLAAAVARANCIAIEPSPESLEGLRENIDINGISSRVDLIPAAAGSSTGTVRLSVGLGPMNHVLPDANGEDAMLVDVTTVDRATEGRAPTIMKIDAEGWEREVLEGAKATLRHPEILAVIMETDGFEERVGTNSGRAHRIVLDAGFTPFVYDPTRRELSSRKAGVISSNIIYVRSAELVRKRLVEAAPFRLPGGRKPI